MGYSPEEVNNILGQIFFNRWINVGETAPVPVDFTTKSSNESEALALAYIALNGTGSPDNYQVYNDYYSNLKLVFHTTLQANIESVNIAILEKIDADLGVTADVNPEVRKLWYPLGLYLFYDTVYDPAHDWISSMGRSKYLNPVYRALEDSGQHDLGVEWFDENKDFYHPVAATTLEGILGIEETVVDDKMLALQMKFIAE